MKFVFSLSKKRLIVVGAVLLACVLVVSGLYGLKRWEDYNDSQHLTDHSDEQNKPIFEFLGQKYTPKTNVESVLFLGVDEDELSISDTNVNGTQADLLMLYVLDHDEKSYTGVQINRDTIVKFNTIGLNNQANSSIKAQIALSHAFGTGGEDSSRNTLDAVSKLFFNMKLDHFYTIRMNAIPILNDAVGGVTVELLDDFSSLDPAYTKGATVTLKGDQATAYVQYRAQLEDSSNVSRMERQKQYMSAWTSLFFEKFNTDEDFVISAFKGIADYMQTDMSVNTLDELADDFSSYKSMGVLNIAGDPPVKGEAHMEFYPDEAALQELFIDLFCEPVS